MYKTNRRQVRKIVESSLNYCETSKKAKKMCAIQYNSGDKTLEVVQKVIPDCLDGNMVLIKTAYAGISGTDLKIISGQYPIAPNTYLTPGHELTGFVCKSAGNFEAGDCVVANPTRGCQTCDQCLNKNEHLCRKTPQNHLGIDRDGGWQDYCEIPSNQLEKIPENISMADALLAAPISSILHTWPLLKPITPAEKILIIGGGFIGNLFAAFFHFKGFRKVTVCEKNIQKLNITVGLNTGFDLMSPECLDNRVKRCRLFDVVVDCSGDRGVVQKAVDYLNYGGRFCIFGTVDPNADVGISPWGVYRNGLSIFASKFNPAGFAEAFDVIEAMGERYVAYEKLGLRLFKLREFGQALEFLRRGCINKGVFCFLEQQM